MYYFLLGQSHWNWPIPWQRWHLMSDVRPVGTLDQEGFAAPAPCRTEALLGFIARVATVEGIDNVEGGREAKVVIEERPPEGVAILDGAVDAERGVKDVFVFVGWRPYQSFSANIAS
jgi:hypothetical protein